MPLPRKQARTRVEFYLLTEDVATLDAMAEEKLTTRGDLIRDALFAHYLELRRNERARKTRAYDRAVKLVATGEAGAL